jgi:hypothetical protein
MNCLCSRAQLLVAARKYSTLPTVAALKVSTTYLVSAYGKPHVSLANHLVAMLSNQKCLLTGLLYALNAI